MLRSLAEPVWFCEAILRCPNDPWQTELIEAVADVYRHKHGLPTRFNHDGLNMVTVRSCHNPGKTHWLAKTMHWFNFVFPGRIVATAPKEDQLKTRLWSEFRKIRRNAIQEYRDLTRVDTLKIMWEGDPDWVALAETAAAGENLAGHHWDFLLIVVDEASGVNEELFPVIEGALGTGKIVVLLMIGNPTRTQGTFYESHMRERVAKHYYKKHVHPDEAPRVDKKWIQRMEDKYGKNSPVVKVRCYGEFCETEKDQLIALEWLVRAKGSAPPPDGSFPRKRVVCDVADGGTAETIVIGGSRYEAHSVLHKMTRHSFDQSLAPIQAADACEQMFELIGADIETDDMVIDANGVGSGCAGALIRRGYRVIRYRGGTDSDNKKKWRNRRVQSYMVTRDQLFEGILHYDPEFCDEDDWEEYLAQMCAIKRKPGLERLEDLLTKEELLRLISVNVDMADCTAMWNATQKPTQQAPVEIATVIRRPEPVYEGAI